jgi:hypothetical protein
MSVLYLEYESGERTPRVARLSRSGAHLVVSAPIWPTFYELAKREKPYAIAIDFSQAPSHVLETADYLAKAKETKEASFYLLRVPDERFEAIRRRLPQATVVTEAELVDRLVRHEEEARARAREKKEAALAARKAARARKEAEKAAAGIITPAARRAEAAAAKAAAKAAKEKEREKAKKPVAKAVKKAAPKKAAPAKKKAAKKPAAKRPKKKK